MHHLERSNSLSNVFHAVSTCEALCRDLSTDMGWLRGMEIKKKPSLSFGWNQRSSKNEARIEISYTMYYYRCEISNEIITYWNKNLSYFSFLFLFFLFFLRKQFCFYLISRDNDNDKILNFLKLRMNSRIDIINSYILWFFSWDPFSWSSTKFCARVCVCVYIVNSVLLYMSKITKQMMKVKETQDARSKDNDFFETDSERTWLNHKSGIHNIETNIRAILSDIGEVIDSPRYSISTKVGSGEPWRRTAPLLVSSLVLFFFLFLFSFVLFFYPCP